MEGEPSHSHDLDLGDFAMRFSIARKQEPPEGGRKPKFELGDPEMIQGMMAAIPMLRSKPDVTEDGRELWSADLCPACTLEVFKQALVKAQTDSIVEALTDSVGEFHE